MNATHKANKAKNRLHRLERRKEELSVVHVKLLKDHGKEHIDTKRACWQLCAVTERLNGYMA